jgi:hypothetical protein
VGRELWQGGIQAPPDGDSQLQFVVSDAPAQFAAVGARFLGDRVKDIETLTFS